MSIKYFNIYLIFILGLIFTAGCNSSNCCYSITEQLLKSYRLGASPFYLARLTGKVNVQNSNNEPVQGVYISICIKKVTSENDSFICVQGNGLTDIDGNFNLFLTFDACFDIIKVGNIDSIKIPILFEKDGYESRIFNSIIMYDRREIKSTLIKENNSLPTTNIGTINLQESSE